MIPTTEQTPKEDVGGWFLAPTTCYCLIFLFLLLASVVASIFGVSSQMTEKLCRGGGSAIMDEIIL
jgi:hypothetical protein